MLFKKILLSCVILGILLSVTGCWDAMDVNGRTLIVTVISDKQGDDFAFYIETPNIGMGQNQQIGAADNKQKYYTLYAKGSTFADARRHLNAKVDNPIFLGTVKALVITDELAKYGIEEYMLRMQSDIQYRKALNVVTSFSHPNDILSVMPPNNVSVGESIDDTIAGLNALGKIEIYTVSDILEFIYSKTCFVMINMDVVDNVLTYDGYTVFHNNKMIDFIPVEESRGLLWILNDAGKRIYVLPVKDCNATMEADLNRKTITPYYENGKLTFDLQYQLNTQVMYLSKNIKLDETQQKNLKSELQNKVAEEIADAIKHSRGIKCDYLHFKEYFRIKYPNEIETINWLDTYLNAEFKISVESNLTFGSMMDFEATGD